MLTASAGTRHCLAVWCRKPTFAGCSTTPPSLVSCWITEPIPMPALRLRKQLRFVPDESMHEYRDVTPLAWGERFHGPGSPATPGSASPQCN